MISNLHLKNKIAWFRPLRVLVVFLLAFASIPRALAQQGQIDALAARVAEELNKRHERTVVVFDFVGPDKKSTALGQKIADDFSDALKKASPQFNVIDRTQITQAAETNRIAPQILQQPEMALWMAKKLRAAFMVFGRLESDGKNLKISVYSYRVSDGFSTKGFKTTVPLTEQMKSLMDTPPEVGKDQPATIPSAGKNGYSVPVCIYCPPAEVPLQAAANHTQGTVVLEVIVGPDGRAHDVRVVNMLSDGLIESAIETVLSWKFKPAISPDGTPTAVRQTIEVTFHLYNQ
jgi:TonB family protein